MVKIKRVFSRANHETFKIPKIGEKLKEYVKKGQIWADPFAGDNSLASLTNDLNPTKKTKYHLDAIDFCNLSKVNNLDGVLFDPPYSYRQISEHYKIAGIKASRLDTSFNFYNRVMENLKDKIKIGGYAISFGWNSNGFGKKKGFELKEILLIAHGQHHNDTIMVIESKIKVSE